MAGRKAVSVNANSKHLTKDEKLIREATEDKIKGSDDKLVAPEYLTESQKSIFDYIVGELRQSNILGNLDVFMLEKAAVSIERSQNMEKQINENPSLLESPTFMTSKQKYDTLFLKACGELCLSPAARAKIAIANVAKVENKNPLLAALEDDDEEDE